MRVHQFLLTAAGALTLALPAGAAERQLVLKPEATQVTFELGATGHDVEGVVGVESGVIRFDSETGAASGEIVLDAAHAQTGNSSRDKTMQQDVLEVASFPEIRFRAARVDGSLPVSGKGELTLRGTILIHGAEHPLALPTEVTVDGDRIDAVAKATIPYQDWGLKDPSILFLRVAKVVSVSIHAQGALSSEPAVASATGGR